MILGAHHIGIAVNDLKEATSRYENVFDVKASNIIEEPDRGIRATLLYVGNLKLELIEHMDEKATHNTPEHITHVCFIVDDIHKHLASVEAKGIPLREKGPRTGITGTVAFLHPEAMKGVSIEFVDSATAI